MNIRIKRIAKESGICVDDTSIGGWPNESLTVVEKFAQAIVNDVLEEVTTQYLFNGQIDIESIRKGYNSGVYTKTTS